MSTNKLHYKEKDLGLFIKSSIISDYNAKEEQFILNEKTNEYNRVLTTADKPQTFFELYELIYGISEYIKTELPNFWIEAQQKCDIYNSKNDISNKRTNKYYLPYILTTNVTSLNDKQSNQKGGVSILCLDYDNGSCRVDIEKLLSEYNYISYNSYNHGVKDGDRFRVIMPLDAAYNHNVYSIIKNKLVEHFNGIDNSSFKVNTLMNLPAFYENERDPQIKYNEGKPFSFKSFIINAEKEVAVNRILSRKIATNNNNDEQLPTNLIERSYVETEKLHGSLGKGNISNSACTFFSKTALRGISLDDVLVWIGNNNIMYPIHEKKLIQTAENAYKKFFQHSTSKIKYHHSDFAKKAESTIIFKHEITIKENEYISKVSDKFNMNESFILWSDTGSGKTTFITDYFNKTGEPVVLITPTISIIQQEEEKAKNNNITVKAVYQGKEVDLLKKIHIGTYESITKILGADIKKAKETTLVIDECHIFATHTHKQDIFRSLLKYKKFFKNVIYMTGTYIPIQNVIEDTLPIIRIHKEKKDFPIKVVQNFGNFETFVKEHTKSNKLHFVYLNDKSKAEKYKKFLDENGKNVLLINSDKKTDETISSVINNQRIPSEYDVVFFTSFFGEGMNIYVGDRQVGNFIDMERTDVSTFTQIVNRVRDGEFDNLYSFLSKDEDGNFDENVELIDVDFNEIDQVNSYKDEQDKLISTIIDIYNTSEFDKDSISKLLESNKSVFYKLFKDVHDLKGDIIQKFIFFNIDGNVVIDYFKVANQSVRNTKFFTYSSFPAFNLIFKANGYTNIELYKFYENESDLSIYNEVCNINIEESIIDYYKNTENFEYINEIGFELSNKIYETHKQFEKYVDYDTAKAYTLETQLNTRKINNQLERLFFNQIQSINKNIKEYLIKADNNIKVIFDISDFLKSKLNKNIKHDTLIKTIDKIIYKYDIELTKKQISLHITKYVDIEHELVRKGNKVKRTENVIIKPLDLKTKEVESKSNFLSISQTIELINKITKTKKRA